MDFLTELPAWFEAFTPVARGLETDYWGRARCPVA
jgi:hypothetical protein